jgi:hypothetical protein
MPARSKKLGPVPINAAEIAAVAKAKPYVQRFIEDEELRNNFRAAIDSSRSAYGRLTNGKSAHKALLDDKKLQGDLRDAVVSLRDATVALNEPPKRKKRRLGRKLLIVVLAAGLALALSESLRSKVLDALFGAEEEFEYTPPPPPASSQPAAPVSAA